MLKISTKQARERWDTLPENLKEAIFSEINADIVWGIGAENHLPEEKINIIATLAGDVLMGFLHPDADEVAKELKNRIDLPAPLTLEIAKELEKKIFNSLRSDLGRIYAPPLEENFKPEPVKENIEETEKPPVLVPPEETGELKPPIKELEKQVEDAYGEKEAPKLEPPSNLPFKSSAQTLDIKGRTKETPVKTEEEILEKPFILHEERQESSPEKPAENPWVSFETKKDFSKPAEKKPVPVRIEIPKTRVVHYSNLRTLIDKYKKID